jgi:glutamate-1-semialdehyde 2,1-aminomutase
LKGSLVFGATPPRNYREFLDIDTALSHCHFLFQHNGGVFLPPWGKSEQWTLSVQHTMADAERFCDNIARLTTALKAVTEHRSAIFGEGSFA